MFDSNQTILPLTVRFDSPMDAKVILYYFTIIIFTVRVGCENCVLSNGEDSLLDFAFVIWVLIWERGSLSWIWKPNKLCDFAFGFSNEV